MAIFRKDPQSIRPKSGQCPKCGTRTIKWHCELAGCGWFRCPKDGEFSAWRNRDDIPRGPGS